MTARLRSTSSKKRLCWSHWYPSPRMIRLSRSAGGPVTWIGWTFGSGSGLGASCADAGDAALRRLATIPAAARTATRRLTNSPHLGWEPAFPRFTAAGLLGRAHQHLRSVATPGPGAARPGADSSRPSAGSRSRHRGHHLPPRVHSAGIRVGVDHSGGCDSGHATADGTYLGCGPTGV